MVIAIWFGIYMICMCSNSAPGMYLMNDNTRRVDFSSLCGFIRFFGPVVVCVCYPCCVGVGYVPYVRVFFYDF